MVIKVSGVVIKETTVGESGKRIVVLTKEHGKMLLSARGSKNTKSKHLASTQLFAYSDFELFEGKGFYSITNSNIKENFFNIRNDIERLSYGAYILQITDSISFEELVSDEVFDLLLRTLYFLSKDETSPKLITSVFIIKLLIYYGFIGGFYCCDKCEAELDEGAYYNDINDGILCKDCETEHDYKLDSGAVKALQYISNSDLKSLFKFNVSDGVLKQLWYISDCLRRKHISTHMKTYDYISNLNIDNE